MSHTEDLKKLDRTIKDAEIRIRTLQASIDAIDKELLNTVALKKTLEENVKCLKTNKVIAIATEYKKVKEELRRIKFRMEALGHDRNNFCSILRDTEALLKKAAKDLQKIKTGGDANVLQFKPGKKDG